MNLKNELNSNCLLYIKLFSEPWCNHQYGEKLACVNSDINFVTKLIDIVNLVSYIQNYQSYKIMI